MSSNCLVVYKRAQNYNRYFYTLIRKLCGLVSAPYFLAKDPYALKVCIKSHLFQKKNNFRYCGTYEVAVLLQPVSKEMEPKFLLSSVG